MKSFEKATETIDLGKEILAGRIKAVLERLGTEVSIRAQELSPEQLKRIERGLADLAEENSLEIHWKRGPEKIGGR